MKKVLLTFALLSAAMVPALNAQAPAGAPAGANGICKDGTYSMAAKKEGACRGHKGVQTWYAAPPANTPAVAGAAAKPAAMPTPTASTTTPRPTPATTPAASTPAPTAASTPAAGSGSKRLSPAAAAAQKPQAPGGGPGLVWVNTASNVYHCNGDPFYGRTKAGAYMSEADAKAKGARGDAGKTCVGK